MAAVEDLRAGAAIQGPVPDDQAKVDRGKAFSDRRIEGYARFSRNLTKILAESISARVNAEYDPGRFRPPGLNAAVAALTLRQNRGVKA